MDEWLHPFVWLHTLISKVHGADMGPIWRQQDPVGPHVGPMNFAILVYISSVGKIIHPGHILNAYVTNLC